MKKIISILIALTMLVSIIPSAFAEGETVESYVETYYFRDDNFNTTTNKGSNVSLFGTAETEGFELFYSGEDKNCYINSTYADYGDRGWKLFDAADDIIEIAAETAKYLRFQSSGYLQSNLADYNSSISLNVAMSLQAPKESGFYIPVMNWGANTGSWTFIWHLDNYTETKDSIDDYVSDKTIVSVDHQKQSTWGQFTDTATTAIYTVSGKEIVSVMTGKNKNYKFFDITMTQILNPIMTASVDNISFDIADGDTTNDTTSASVVVSGKTVVDSTEETITDMPVSNNFITYKSSSDAIATVSADGTVTAVGAGEAKIWAESKDGLVKSNEVTVTVAGATEPSEDEALTNAFDAKEETVNTYVESTVTGLTEDTTIEAEKNSDGTFSLTAPETKSDKIFLYWAKGMSRDKKIVSFSNKLENYMPEEDGKNYLIAVYEGDTSDTAEYYNANGQRIATGTEPALPSMAGYGDATGWAKYGETNIYVAEYENKTQPDNVTVTVDGKANTVPYGTEITCTADSTKENFKCWTKSDINGKTEIVSANETYKFKAWETCTVEAIYEEHTYTGEKFKIIIDTFTAGNATAVMAEFVGFGSDVVEKGIMFEGKRIAMTKPGNQFTVIADESGTYEGYAIVGNQEDGYKLITDGEYKK